MAIQNRRGNYADFDANKMLPGEFAYALDTAELFYCVAPGTVRRCATKEELEQILTSAPEAYAALQELIADLENETVLTGILADISNLKLTKLALTGDSKTNTTTFTEAATLANINSAETHATLFGKIKKFFSFVGTTKLTTTAQTVSAAANEILEANQSGWSMLKSGDSLSVYSAVSPPTYICGTNHDLTGYISVGMKIKLTQTTVKYFFVAAITPTLITIYGGDTYALVGNVPITNVRYSAVQAPYGFPIAETGLGTDFPIEQGSNANGKYTKWASGKLEMTGQVTTPNQTFSAIGQNFYAEYSLQLPKVPVGNCQVFPSISNGQSSWCSATKGVVQADGKIVIYILKSTNLPLSCTVVFHAEGRWK